MNQEDIKDKAANVANFSNSDYSFENKIEIVDDIANLKNGLRSNDNRISRPILTKFELSRIIGYRAQQLNQNCEALVDTKNMVSTLEIAKKELKLGKLPNIIRRELPDGTIEEWKVNELSLPKE
jgi:DNA-directed RNA polymerase subunit K/omega